MSELIRERFWELPLQELGAEEWELLCDHCGRCCLKKLEDEESKEIAWTRIICRFHDADSGRCTCYNNRTEKVPDCINVRQLGLDDLGWMPATCAYRLRMENKDLLPWHPLLTGSTTAMKEAGIYVGGKSLSEEHVHPLGYDEHIVRWVNADQN